MHQQSAILNKSLTSSYNGGKPYSNCILYFLYILYSSIFLYLIDCGKFAVKLYPCMSNSYHVANNLFWNKSFSKISQNIFCILVKDGFAIGEQMRRCFTMQVLVNSISLITSFIELSALIWREMEPRGKDKIQ